MPPIPPPKPVAPKKSGDAPGLVKRLLPWIFIVLGAGAIYVLIQMSPPEKQLNCRAAPGGTGLTGFGSCSTD